jgi:hypothetical protein
MGCCIRSKFRSLQKATTRNHQGKASIFHMPHKKRAAEVARIKNSTSLYSKTDL